jgi:hypothetical protein
MSPFTIVFRHYEHRRSQLCVCKPMGQGTQAVGRSHYYTARPFALGSVVYLRFANKK